MLPDSDPPRSAERPSSSRSSSVALLVLLVGVSYVTVLDGAFIGDDHAAVQMSSLVRGPLDLPAIFTTNYWWGFGGQESSLYRPFTVLSHRLVDSLGGGSIVVHRAVNVALHLAVVLELLALAPVLLGSRRCAFALAALFAVHPVHVEPVALVVGRADLLAALLGLEAWRLARRRTPLALVAATLVAFAACGSKESAFPLVLVAAAAELFRGEGAPRSRILGAGSLGLALTLALVVRVSVLGGVGYPAPPPPSDNPLFHLDLGPRLRGALAVAATYVQLLAWPAVLSSDYSFDQIPVPGSWGSAAVLLGAAALVALAVLALRWRGRFAVAAALALVTYVPVSNLLVPIRTVAGERLIYVPSIGVIALVVLALEPVLRRRPRLAAVALATVLIALGGRTALRNLDWQSEATLMRATAVTSPRSWRAHTAVADVLERGGRLEEAARELEEAVRIDPRVASNHRALAALARRRGDLEAARRHVEDALAVQPQDLWVVLAAARVELDLAERDARPELARRALERLAEVAEQTGDVPSVRIGRARARLVLGDPVAASGELDGLLESRPDRAADVAPVLARVELARGRPARALAALERVDATALPEPERARLEALRATALAAAGERGAARAAWLRVLLLEGGSASALEALVDLLPERAA